MEVYKAINAITEDLSRVGISKDSENKQQNYKFRGIDAVYGALSPLLAKHKLCILPRVVGKELIERQSKNGGALFYTILTVEFDFVSAVDASKHTVTMIGEAMDSADKSSNKAMSAAYKYAAFQAFAIPTEGDNDADATTHEVAHDGMSEKTRADYLAAIEGSTTIEALDALKAKFKPICEKLGDRASYATLNHAWTAARQVLFAGQP